MTFLIHNPLTRFIAQVVAVTVLSRGIGLVARRFSQPLVIAEMLGGIVLGPSLLGWVAPDLWGELFTPDSLVVLRLVSQFGLVFFMFLVGLELDPKHYRGSNAASVLIAQSGIFVPFALGGILAFWIYPVYGGTNTSKIAFVLFTGAAMSVTAFPVLARILTEQRLFSTRIGAVTIACAAIADVTAWCVLAFIVTVARHAALSDAVFTTVAAIGYIGVMLGAVRPLLSKLASRLPAPDAIPQNVIVVVVVFVLLSSWATELIGIHALFGGFLAGVIMPKEHGFAQAIGRRLEDLVVVVFLPLFFASSGLQTQIGLLSGARDWAVCGLIVFIACAGKFGGCAAAARAVGFRWCEASAIGVLMNTRGLMELIVLNIGLELGVISPIVFSMMVIMALVTTIGATPVLRWLAPSLVRPPTIDLEALAPSS
ncbi:MAG TPA: cation:proton antiporter [Kofleriaceae bacterium]|nr:cation:proton antiporter [Kofleriaceae bacterium]